MCWTKFSCLFLVVAQKSSRTMVSCSRSVPPSSVTTSAEDFRPNGGFVAAIDQRRPGSALSESPVWMGLSPVGWVMP